MRIISGSLKGRKLIPPKGLEVRPTADRAKETLFNIISNRYSLEGAKVLDLFCGSGAVGFECISRGADEIVFVDLNTQLVTQNAAHLKVEHLSTILRADAIKFLDSSSDKFDYLFADPPYDFKFYEQLVMRSLLISRVTIIEHPSTYVPGESTQKNLILSRKVGRAQFSIFEQTN